MKGLVLSSIISPNLACPSAIVAPKIESHLKVAREPLHSPVAVARWVEAAAAIELGRRNRLCLGAPGLRLHERPSRLGRQFARFCLPPPRAALWVGSFVVHPGACLNLASSLAGRRATLTRC